MNFIDEKMAESIRDKPYRIYGVDGHPIGHDEFKTFEEALEYGKTVLDLFTIKNMETDELEYSNFLDY
jgi:hypothetical protein